MTTMTLPGFATPATERAMEGDHAEREDSPTPGLLVRALLEAASLVDVVQLRDEHAARVHVAGDGFSTRTLDEPVRVLDVCAGYGVFAQQMRALAHRGCWPVHITGVELHEARREHLSKWCDVVWVRDWFDALRDHHTVPEFDLIVGNPHFTALAPEQESDGMFGGPTSMHEELLVHAPAVLLYHTLNAFQRSAPGRAAARRCPPAARWLVPGTVSHDGTSAVASDCYAASLWLRGHEGPTETRLLDVEAVDVNRRAGLLKSSGEPYKCWRWRGLPPGSEEPSEGLPAAPGWTP